MPKLRVHCLGVSADGYAAGPAQSLSEPMGVGGMALHQWLFPTQTFKKMHAEMGIAPSGAAGTTGADDTFAARGFEGLGAWILGRNMFGPVRGPWPDETWKGWWGETPPYHTPVFVLTHYARPSLTMKGGTVFHFVTGGPREAYDRAFEAAHGQDVRLGGGTNTIRQFLAARLIDEMHLAQSPVLLGAGEHLLGGLDLPALGYDIVRHEKGEGATHFVIARGK